MVTTVPERVGSAAGIRFMSIVRHDLWEFVGYLTGMNEAKCDGHKPGYR